MRARIIETMDQLRGRFPGLRWVSPAQVHLTLRFLGGTETRLLPAIERALAQAAAKCPPAAVAVAGLGLFPERGRARVLWLGLDLPESMLRLQASCEAAAVAAGFEPETRPFRSHLTLGRWREPARRPPLEELELGLAHIERVVLFRSDLRPTGAVYTPLATFPLGKTAEEGE
jgi:RNA 2',3'-cyclic 3'-phosphodiesterase